MQPSLWRRSRSIREIRKRMRCFCAARRTTATIRSFASNRAGNHGPGSWSMPAETQSCRARCSPWCSASNDSKVKAWSWLASSTARSHPDKPRRRFLLLGCSVRSRATLPGRTAIATCSSSCAGSKRDRAWSSSCCATWRSTDYQNAPELIGHVDIALGREAPASLAILQSFVPNEGDAWTFTIDEVQRYFERVLMNGRSNPPGGHPPLLERARLEPPPDGTRAHRRLSRRRPAARAAHGRAASGPRRCQGRSRV